METLTKCSILGCNHEFVNAESANLHSANSWHCISCGFSDNTELTVHNINKKCDECAAKFNKCIRVNFRKKTYVVNGRLSVKEKGQWVHYE